MGYIVSFIAQKGGVGKSTLARALAREASAGGWDVKVADLDTQQGTVADWHKVRLNSGYDPVGSVEVFGTVATALKNADNHDLLVMDAAARASAVTADLAKHSHLSVIPTCASRDDLMPAIRLANELRKTGIPTNKIALALTRVTTEAEIREAREFIAEAGYTALDGCLYEKPAYRQAQNTGLAVTETRYKALNEKAEILMQSILDKIAQ
ncbi:ParA family protein [Octadecabacter ascidiaceicola]|uniref:CobQ/CobB/MinD/ParA nucleotide binding domain protein n=1 Tax=Octadecabacter ascidiaceicola TaxID=1655543 RepID=A0A238KSL9_9RHOB|nr:ParA family protein [Octadecabacter ascidiaceicola]SMX45591.1 CobQ/CobB/MinD/ParA nucleotide binding domain protein [Octadecabacter ascidiaceicola]